jgi:hypothetical protein
MKERAADWEVHSRDWGGATGCGQADEVRWDW